MVVVPQTTTRAALRAGSASVVIEADGGRLASLEIAGRQRLLQRKAERSPIAHLLWGSFLMAPWVGRLRNGELRWEGGRYSFERNLGGHAIHGLAASACWSMERPSDNEVRLRLELARTPWPFGGVVEQEFVLLEGSLMQRARIAATKAATPAALGWHPWFHRSSAGLEIEVPAKHVLAATPDRLPTGSLEPVAGAIDLRELAPLGARALDHAYIGARQATLRWPDVELRLEFGPTITTTVVYAPADAVCVEPQTAWPDAPTLEQQGFAGTGLARLGPGETLAAEQTWSWDA